MSDGQDGGSATDFRTGGPGGAITLSPFYHSAVNAVTEPNRLVFCTRYLITRWSPLLGGTGLQILLYLRAHCYHDRRSGECRNQWQVSRAEIAAAVGVSEATVKRELAHNTALRRFIQPQQEFRLGGGRGGVRRDANSYVIAMDDPVHEDDWPRVEAYVRMAQGRARKAGDGNGREGEVDAAKRRARAAGQSIGGDASAPGQIDPAQGQIDYGVKLTRTIQNHGVKLTPPSGQFDPTESEENSRNSNVPPFNVGEAGSKASPWERRQAALADEAMALTGDEKSRKRYRQLAGIALEAGAEELWRTARRATELRLTKSREPLVAPGAYFCGVLTKLLAAAGVYVPVGSKEERNDVKAQIALSLGQSAGDGVGETKE